LSPANQRPGAPAVRLLRVYLGLNRTILFLIFFPNRAETTTSNPNPPFCTATSTVLHRHHPPPPAPTTCPVRRRVEGPDPPLARRYREEEQEQGSPRSTCRYPAATERRSRSRGAPDLPLARRCRPPTASQVISPSPPPPPIPLGASYFCSCSS
jgi:hypothetical protein